MSVVESGFLLFETTRINPPPIKPLLKHVVWIMRNRMHIEDFQIFELCEHKFFMNEIREEKTLILFFPHTPHFF